MWKIISILALWGLVGGLDWVWDSFNILYNVNNIKEIQDTLFNIQDLNNTLYNIQQILEQEQEVRILTKQEIIDMIRFQRINNNVYISEALYYANEALFIEIQNEYNGTLINGRK